MLNVKKYFNLRKCFPITSKNFSILKFLIDNEEHYVLNELTVLTEGQTKYSVELPPRLKT